MPSTIQVLALPSVGWNYGGERDDFMAIIRACNPSPYYIVNGYSTAADLVQRIQGIIDSDADHPALTLLEIWTHAHPGRIDALSINNAGEWGKALKRVRFWADEASLYLSGCNTGLTPNSVAKVLALAIAFESGQFEHRIRVYGAAGYLYGTHACGPPRTECVYIRSGERLRKVARFIWGFVRSFGSLGAAMLESMTVDVEFKPYSGCRSESGDAAYNEFPNWT